VKRYEWLRILLSLLWLPSGDDNKVILRPLENKKFAPVSMNVMYDRLEMHTMLCVAELSRVPDFDAEVPASSPVAAYPLSAYLQEVAQQEKKRESEVQATRFGAEITALAT